MTKTIFIKLSIFMLVTSFLVHYNSSSSYHDNDDEVIALISWKVSLQKQNNSSVLFSWASSVSKCSWYGVSCNSNGNIVKLDLSSSSLMGTLDSFSFSSFPNLTHFNLSVNNLSGIIPSEIYSFSRLTFLDFSYNCFSSMIPQEIGLLKNLYVVFFYKNNLYGSIPHGICHMYLLSSLDLSFNNLTGDIPSCLSKMTNLQNLNLEDNNLVGSIPHELGNLSSLNTLVMYSNHLTMPIPNTIGKLSKLLILSVSYNSLNGSIPHELGNLSSLNELYLSFNRLTMPITDTIGKLSKLVILSVLYNSLNGSIPHELGNLSNLNELYLQKNNLIMTIPRTIGKLYKLANLNMGFNTLYGSIPVEVANLSSILNIQLQSNNLMGSIPTSLGVLRYLTNMFLSLNNLSGPIPEELGNITSLVNLQLGYNRLNGFVPKSLGKLLNLKILFLENNSFDGPLSSFSDTLCNEGRLEILLVNNNRFTENIPKSLYYNCSSLARLDFQHNQLSGNISEIFGVYPNLYYFNLNDNKVYGELTDNWSKCKSLSIFKVGGNYISGRIPTYLASSTNIEMLNLSFNELSGEIPIKFERMNRITNIELNDNQFSGSLPQELRSLTKLLYLDVSMNNLYGSIPYDLANCKSLYHLNLGNNKLTGEIPIELSTLLHLSVLNLSHNFLNSQIPSQISSLRSLESLNLSHNQLSGGVPKSMETMLALSSIDISYNQLQGPVPNSKGFLNARVEGNKGLCGNITGLHQCNNSIRARDNRKKLHSIIVVAFLAGGTLLVIIMRVSCRHKKVQSSTTGNLDEDECAYFVPHFHYQGRRIYDDILTATCSFDKEFCIGTGGFGCVYKVKLPSLDKMVAVKRFNNPHSHRTSSFSNEVKVLGKISHRSIVNFLGYYFNGEISLIIYPYLEEGDLYHLLRSQKAQLLDWEKRVNIITDIASALSYMHHYYHLPIVHRDISSKNILLNSDYKARISDFGTSIVLNPQSTDDQVAAAGTIGYIAPEVATTMKVTEKVDVYSFGILTLEVIKGDNMPDTIDRILQNKTCSIDLEDAIDPRLLFPSLEMQKVLKNIVSIAIHCLHINPRARHTMYDICEKLSNASSS